MFRTQKETDFLGNVKFNTSKHAYFNRLLGESESGRLLQRKILTALCQLRNLPDKEVPDRDAGLDALRKLKELALAHDLVAREQIDTGVQRKQAAADHARILQERAAKLESLRQMFNAAVIDPDR